MDMEEWAIAHGAPTEWEAGYPYDEFGYGRTISRRPNNVNKTTVRLYGSTVSETIETPVISILFGHMVQRVLPVTRHYLSDLFHDAEWLRENVTRPMWFWYVVRVSGTDIGELAQTKISNARSLLSKDDVVYRVEVTRDDLNVWYATFEMIPASDFIANLTST